METGFLLRVQLRSACGQSHWGKFGVFLGTFGFLPLGFGASRLAASRWMLTNQKAIQDPTEQVVSGFWRGVLCGGGFHYLRQESELGGRMTAFDMDISLAAWLAEGVSLAVGTQGVLSEEVDPFSQEVGL